MAASQLSNRISFTISPEQLAHVQAVTQDLQATLLPLVVELGPDDRRVLPKMSTKTVEFVTKTLEHMRANPDLKPGYVDIDEFSRDLDAVRVLRSMLAPLQQIVDLLDDSLTLSASEAYSAALVCYQGAKGAARLNMPGAKVVVDDLARQFAGRGVRAGVPGTPAPASRPAGA
jgi:hypothetical protein